MKQVLLSIGLAFTLSTAAATARQAAQPAPAQQQAPKPAPTKVAVVDFVLALSETAEGKKEFAVVGEWVEKQNEGLKKEGSEFDALRNRYLQDQMKMTPEARADMERQIQDRELRLRRRQEDLDQELGHRRQEILTRLGTKMQQIVQQYGEQNNYLAILIAQEGMFAWVAPAGDLTPQMIKLYDSKYPATAAAPAPVPAPAKKP